MDATLIAVLIKAAVDAVVALVQAGASHADVLKHIQHMRAGADVIRADVDRVADGG